MNKSISAWLGFGLAVFAAPVMAANVDLSKLPPASKQTSVTYAKDIRPMLEASCFRCHGADRPKAGLRLDSLADALKGGKEGKVISPGQSEKSKLVIAVARLDKEIAMPPEPRQGRSRGGPGGKRGGEGDGKKAPTGKDGGQRGGPPQPPAKPLTTEQVGLIRAWVDQGAK
jgi:hypothetical protein